MSSVESARALGSDAIKVCASHGFRPETVHYDVNNVFGGIGNGTLRGARGVVARGGTGCWRPLLVSCPTWLGDEADKTEK